ncbi:hypothetical protein LI328DRAFT_60301 [Trichoderma asperelloides]|nr:hypothetical protein LI328DRAFT_60301 [Trichoderma asperelloides]
MCKVETGTGRSGRLSEFLVMKQTIENVCFREGREVEYWGARVLNLSLSNVLDIHEKKINTWIELVYFLFNSIPMQIYPRQHTQAISTYSVEFEQLHIFCCPGRPSLGFLPISTGFSKIVL